MKDLEEKCLRFVLKHYRVNKLDTQKALQTFRHKHAIPESKSGPGSYVMAFCGDSGRCTFGVCNKDIPVY